MAATLPVKAVLCGDLNMIRCFSSVAIKRAGLAIETIPTIVASARGEDIAFSSRYVSAGVVIADPAEAPEQTARDLLDLGRAIGDRPVLFYGTDAMLLCVSRHREALSKVYRFLMPPADRIEAIVDKTQFADLGRRLGLPIPTTLVSSEIDSAASILSRIPLPCALKPSCHIGFRGTPAVQEEGGMPRKALFARTPEELAARLDRMRRSTGTFLVQSYVAGGDENLLSFHAWVNEAGETFAHYVGRKIRTYPSGSGESTYIELSHDDEVTRIGLSVVRALGIRGVVKLDFKRDANTGELYLLEANPRFNLWNHLGAKSGVNLPLIAYAELSGLPMDRPGPVVPGQRWLSFESDLRAFLGDYGPRGVLGFREWLASYRGPKIYDVFAWDDPLPFAVSMWRRLEARASRLAGKRASA